MQLNQSGGADQYDASTICSDAKEFEQGLSDSGTLQLDFNWAGNQAVQTAIRNAGRSRLSRRASCTMAG